MNASIYLDYNATTPLRPKARAAMQVALDSTGNPSSVHSFGRAARRLVENARMDVAALVGAAPAQVVFTGGGTEANNAALHAFSEHRVLVSAIEHDSVLHGKGGVEIIPVLPDGRVDVAALESMLAASSRPTLVSVMMVNNETGVIQPVAEVVAVARKHKAFVHTDAIQAAGKLPLSLSVLDVDLLTLSAHKLGGPQGIGALVVREGLDIAPLLRGGGQERRRRAGTENVIGIAGFGAAAAASRPENYAALAQLRDRLEKTICAAVPDVSIHGASSPRVANTSCLSMLGAPSEKQVMAFDLAGIAVSAGSACSSGKVKASHVLQAMGVPEDEAASAIRVSLGWHTTEADIDRFCHVWLDIRSRLGASSYAPSVSM